MAVSVTLPALGESVTEGTVTRWLKAEGERVEADEPLLEVSTDKVDTEIPAPASGVLSSIKVAEDETVEVGAELALIDDGSGAPAAEAAPAAQQVAEPAPEPAPAAPSTEQAAPAPAPTAQAAAGQGGGGSAEGTDVVLPALGESVTEGTVTRWLKSVGESVEADEPLLEVSTDKVDTEIPAPASGTLLEIVVGEDETAEVGAKLAVIGAAGAAPAAAPAAPAAPAQPEPTPAPAQPAPAPAPTPAPAPAAPAPAPAAPAPQASPAPAPQQT
ncbi:biotin/lipoyl-containing protein, partial [Streptomyces sp. AC627_RSS907]|uniref:biotin/lipoyl-containing protein n=1 Tax=Streptomyces sp. AC627_RSS907 TaxID=2823684 RepID=UPI00266564A4